MRRAWEWRGVILRFVLSFVAFGLAVYRHSVGDTFGMVALILIGLWPFALWGFIGVVALRERRNGNDA
jgi:hypothetical protein